MWAVAHETFVIHNNEHAQTYILTSQAPTPPPPEKNKLGIFLPCLDNSGKWRWVWIEAKLNFLKNNFEKKNQVFLSFILKLTMEITVPSCGIPHPRKTEFFAGWEMLDALVPKIRFHEQAYQSGRESSNCVTYS